MNSFKRKKDIRNLFRRLRKYDMVRTVDYRRTVDEPVYDVTLGTETSTTETLKISIILTDYIKNELSDSVRITDMKAIYMREDVPLIPKIDDKVVDGSTVYTVISFTAPDSAPTIELQLRAA